MFVMTLEVWTEKYRPKSLDQVVNQKHAVERLKAWVKDGSIPNMMFAGRAGIGKTTVALALAKDLFGDHWKENFQETNASDERGIDVALLYQERYFKPVHHKNYELKLFTKEGQQIFTRDQLLVTGYLDGELIHIIVNHWPSKRGGSRSIPYRKKAAALNLKIMSEIRTKEPNAKIITMGDFNDDPIESSFKEILKTKSKKEELKENDLYNPYEHLFKTGLNTGGYRDNISLFDQIILSSQLVTTNNEYDNYKLYQSKIFNPKFLINQKGRYKGYPNRSFSYGKYSGGYSDHFPVYIYLIREAKN